MNNFSLSQNQIETVRLIIILERIKSGEFLGQVSGNIIDKMAIKYCPLNNYCFTDEELNYLAARLQSLSAEEKKEMSRIKKIKIDEVEKTIYSLKILINKSGLSCI